MKWFHFILSHSIFISVCAAALCFQTYELLSVIPDPMIYLLVFCSTLSSYNLYWLISKYSFSTQRKPELFFAKHFSNLLLFVLASIGVVAAIYSRPQVIPFVGGAVLLTLLYSLPLWPVKALHVLRKAGFLKTVLLSFTWAFVTIMIPLQVDFFNITADIAILFIARFSFMLMLCTIFDSRDIAIDKIHALRSLATDVSRKSLRIIMITVFLIYISAGAFLRMGYETKSQVIAFIVTGLLVLYIYTMSLKKQGYIFYYFVVDGLMLFSAIATYVASI